MIRNFRDLLDNIFGGKSSDDGPDLFEYANQETSQNVNRSPEKEPENKKNRKIAAAVLAALYPAVFAAGYYIHDFKSDCSEIEEPVPEEEDVSTVPDLPPGARQYVGRYSADVSGHKAILFIYPLKAGGLGGAIRFTEWGKRELEYLKAVRVDQSYRISFIRSCKGAECVKIGSPSNIYQVYSGTLSPEGNKIDGNYTGGQSASSWTAERIR